MACETRSTFPKPIAFFILFRVATAPGTTGAASTKTTELEIVISNVKIVLPLKSLFEDTHKMVFQIINPATAFAHKMSVRFAIPIEALPAASGKNFSRDADPAELLEDLINRAQAHHGKLLANLGVHHVGGGMVVFSLKGVVHRQLLRRDPHSARVQKRPQLFAPPFFRRFFYRSTFTGYFLVHNYS